MSIHEDENEDLNNNKSPNIAELTDSPKEKVVHSQSDSGQIQQDSPLKMVTDSQPASTIKKRTYNEFIAGEDEEPISAAAASAELTEKSLPKPSIHNNTRKRAKLS